MKVNESWGATLARRASAVVATALLTVAAPAAEPESDRIPARIVSLVPAVTEMLFAIGAGPQVVGVSSFDTYPREVASRQRVGALVDPDLERVLALRPQLAVIYSSQEDLRRQLSRAAIPVFDYRHADLADITTTLREIGARVGRAADADRVAAAIEQRLEATRRRVAARPRSRVLLVFGREAGTLRNIYASGGYGFLHDMLVVAGGENVVGDVQRESVQATTELILARRPDVIVEIRASGLNLDAARNPDPAWKALASVPAVRTNRIVVLAGNQFVVPGPRVADAVEQMARALHPEAF
jgi:iron complex transport system substrate-binding protein